MMNKKRSSRIQVTRFLFVLPLLLVLLAAFSKHQPGILIHQCFGFVVDSKTLQPIEGVIITEKFSGLRTISDEKGYFRIVVPIKDTSNTMKFDAIFDKPGMVEASSSFSVSLEGQHTADNGHGTFHFVGMNVKDSSSICFEKIWSE